LPFWTTLLPLALVAVTLTMYAVPTDKPDTFLYKFVLATTGDPVIVCDADQDEPPLLLYSTLTAVDSPWPSTVAFRVANSWL
jgi:hypothetical protein